MKNNGHLFPQSARSAGSRHFAGILSRRLGLLLVAMWFSTAMLAQITIGTPNQTEMPPIKSNHNFSYTQQLYFQNEINTAGQITAVRFYFYGDNGDTPTSLSNSNSWTIYMGHTTATSLSVGSFLPVSGMTQVFNGTIAANPPIGWITITLQTPFTYNNVNNLVIAVDENAANNNGGTGNDWVSYSNPGGPIRQTQAYGTTNINPASPPGPNIAFAGIPYTGLVFGTPPSCVPNPTSPADAASLCGAQAVTLTWPAAPGATSYVVLLDDDPALTSADIVATVSGTSYTTATLGVATWYWALIPINGSGQANNCFIWEFYIDPIPTGNTFADPIVISSLPYTASSNNITALTCYTNTFGQPSPDVFYRFTTTACQSRVDISLCGAIVFNNYLHLLNSSGATIATNDDNGPLCSGVAASLRMDNLPAGTYYIVVEGSGSAVGPYTLNVSASDITPPTIACPANITQPNTVNTCGRAVTFSNATATDNCPGTPTITQISGPTSGSTFPVGTTSVSFRASDATNNSATCSFNVTINDTQLPSVTCPANITQPNTANTCGALVSFANATATDNCTASPTITQTGGPASGSTFSVGTTSVTFRASDAANNSATCSFTVTVNDTQTPNISCPANTTQNNTTNQCGANVTFNNATATDNCTASPTITLTGGPASGSSFPIGTTAVTFRATDAANNSATCSFTVTVNDTQAPNISCPANITQPNTANTCGRVVTFSNATATDNCPGTPTIIQIGGPASGSTFPVGTTSVSFRASDATNNSSTCSFTVTINDTQVPSITCPANLVSDNAPGQCGANVTFASATATDNCTASPTITQTGGPASGSTFSVGTTAVTFRATDATNNSSTCSFNVTVNDTEPPVVVCPSGVPNFHSNQGTCNPVVIYWGGNNFYFNYSDNCSGYTYSQSPAAGTPTTLGPHTQSVTLVDAAGLSTTCTFTVRYIETIPPTISCPANIVANNAPGTCTATVTYASPTASDNCAPAPTVTQTSGLASGATFSAGITTNVFRATDFSGTIATCSFTVTVNDTQGPTITCPATQTVAANAACQATLASYTGLGNASDNCTANPSKVQSPAVGTTLNPGTTVVTLTATDAAGLSGSCTFIVSVADQTPPTISCPAAQTVAANAACQASLASYTAMGTASDNCTASPAKTQSPAVGTTLNPGTTVVTLTATDAAGLSGTCTFTVSVIDQIPPTITCPTTQTIPANTSCQASLAIYTGLGLASDNCTASPAKTQLPAAGTNIPLGTTTVSLTATDGAGLTASCTFNVAVTDQTPPGIACPAVQNVAVNAACSASLANYTSLGMASDNCTANPAKTQSPAAGTILALGTTVVTLTATDGAGLTASCTFNVAVTDQTPPTITCPAAQTVAANAACQASLASYTGLGVAADNCTASPAKSQLPATGTTLALGTTLVTLTATDAAGLSGSCTFNVAVTDQTPPTIACPATQSVVANTSCQASLASYTGLGAAADNCTASPAKTQSPVAGTTLALGTTIVTLTATDGAGLSASCTFNVTVVDQTLPTIACPANQTLNNNPNLCSAVATYATPAASDNCSVSALTRTQGLASGSAFPVGINTVTYQASDPSGNAATCSFTITVNDMQLPTIACPANIVINNSPANNCSAVVAYSTPAASDNCAIGSNLLLSGLASGATFPVGTTTNTWRATDVNSNSATCSFTVQVNDVTPPAMTCPANQTVNAGSSCTGTVGSWSPVSLTDNCSPAPTFTQSPAASTTLTGHNDSKLVTLTATDAHNNSASCSFTVTLKDVTPPVAKCKNATLNLGANGTLTLQPSSVNNASTDNCTFSLSVTPGTFGCGNLGNNTVTLKATDAGGNTSTCTAVVNIKDLTPPTASCKTINVYLDDSGHASITPAAVNNNSYDACGIALMTINNNQFDCGQIGGSPVTVQLTIKDVNNNTASCLASVYVKDNIAPTAECTNTSVSLSASGYATVATAPLAANSTDNCSVTSYSPVVKVYTTANLGVNNLTITVKDWSNNSATCVSQVTVYPYGTNLPAPGLSEEMTSAPETGLLSARRSLDLSVFPNPATDQSTLSFHLEKDQPYHLRLFDLNGRLVLDTHVEGFAGDNSVVLELSEIDAGIYLIDLQSDGCHGQKKLVLQR